MKPETVIAYREALGGRRFLLTVGAGIVDTVLLVIGKIDQLTYSNLTLWTVAAYIAAGTAQKVQNVFSSRKSKNRDVPHGRAHPGDDGDGV